MKSVILMMLLALVASTAIAQTTATPEDVSSPEAIVAAAYDVIQRAPGEDFDWDRFRSLFLESAVMIPNTQQTGGEHLVFTVQDFIDWASGGTTIGGENDRGFAEEEVANVTEVYGDIAHVFSTYQRHYWDDDEILGRGINSFQLVYAHDRWWISAIAWDEESGAGPVPEEYLP